MLLLRRAESAERLATEAERLARVEARLKQLEEVVMGNYDVIVKLVAPVRVLALTEEVPGDGTDGAIGPAQGRLWPRLHERLDQLGVDFAPPSIAREIGSDPISLTTGLPVPDDIEDQVDGFETIELPGIDRVAATVIHGDPNYDEAVRTLRQWIIEAGETATGEYREVYLDCDGPRDTWVVELQLALTPRA